MNYPKHTKSPICCTYHGAVTVEKWAFDVFTCNFFPDTMFGVSNMGMEYISKIHANGLYGDSVWNKAHKLIHDKKPDSIEHLQALVKALDAGGYNAGSDFVKGGPLVVEDLDLSGLKKIVLTYPPSELGYDPSAPLDPEPKPTSHELDINEFSVRSISRRVIKIT